MLKSAIIVISCALIGCWAAPALPTPGPHCDVKCENPNGFFADHNYPQVFYQCAHNKCLGVNVCATGLVFSNHDQTCEKAACLDCPEKEGSFPLPSNPHHYIECFDSCGVERSCSTDLVFNATSRQCTFNDEGVTYPEDINTVGPTQADQASSKAPVAGTTSAPVVSAGTTASGACTRVGMWKDPDNDKKYHICKNGKEIVVPCPDGMTFDDELDSCA